MLVLMPKLWSETIETHRDAVRDSIVRAALELVNKRGLLSASMTDIAAAAGIGRATLYKYFPSVEAILDAWHNDQIDHHLQMLKSIAVGTPSADRLGAVLEAYAQMIHATRHHHSVELAALLHRDAKVGSARRHLRDLLSRIVSADIAAGAVRSDLSASEIADYCIAALAAAGELRSPVSVGPLVETILMGLRGARRPGAIRARR